MARTYLTIVEALEAGYTKAADEDGRWVFIKNMDELDILDTPYIVVDGVIDDDGLFLKMA